MKQALYRNWRPRSFKELIGQDHVTTTLERALKSGRVSHAYLFTGPRGVGKTSAARILAHAANNLPYDDESAHLDIIEIDAASNRRIDEIRDLREKVAIAPAAGKYKVYIIDEVHMLTREAFNALLKTLEEPPAHTIFILATTEAHKLPETIISRTQRFEFKPLAGAQMAKHLQKIAKAEKIDISPSALDLLAEFGGGSFRDSISFLDQLSAAGGAITEQDVRDVLGLPSGESISSLVGHVSSGDNSGIISSIQKLKEQGIDAAAVAAELAKQIRTMMVEGGYQPRYVNLLKQLIEVPASSRPYDYLEVSLLEAGSHITPAPKEPEVKDKPKNIPAIIEAKRIDKPAKVQTGKFDMADWPRIVDGCREKAASLYTALRLAEPDFSDGKLLLRFQFPLHQKKLVLSANKALIEDLIESITGEVVHIDCVVDKEFFKSSEYRKVRPVPKEEVDDNPMSSISNIFGKAEVVEI
jgi:DNA polymerase-3 subunit gamma/tau